MSSATLKPKSLLKPRHDSSWDPQTFMPNPSCCTTVVLVDCAGNIRNGHKKNNIFTNAKSQTLFVLSIRINACNVPLGANHCHDGTLPMAARSVRLTSVRPQNQEKQRESNAGALSAPDLSGSRPKDRAKTRTTTEEPSKAKRSGESGGVSSWCACPCVGVCLLVLLSGYRVVRAVFVRCLSRPLLCRLLLSECVFPCGRRPYRYPRSSTLPSLLFAFMVLRVYLGITIVSGDRVPLTPLMLSCCLLLISR